MKPDNPASQPPFCGHLNEPSMATTQEVFFQKNVNMNNMNDEKLDTVESTINKIEVTSNKSLRRP